MEIRPYIPADAPALESLLREIWGDDPRALQYYRRFGPLVAEVAGRPVGFGSAWTNPFHPHALYVAVNVHPAWQRQGIGTRLLEALGGGDLPLQASTWENHGEFLLRRGFVAVRRTWEPVLHVADVAFRDEYAERCLARGYRFVSLSDTCEAKVAALLAEVYTEAHRINPPRPMALQGWLDLLRKDPPVAAASFVALHGGEYVAMCLAHDDQPISWCGVTTAHRQYERDLILALTLRQVAWAAGQGLSMLQGEFDSTNPWAMIQMGALPFRPAPCWVTFQRPPGAACR